MSLTLLSFKRLLHVENRKQTNINGKKSLADVKHYLEPNSMNKSNCHALRFCPQVILTDGT